MAIRTPEICRVWTRKPIAVLSPDVALKRKIRNYVSLEKEGEPGFAIYMQEKSVLNNQHKQAYAALSIEPEANKLPKDEAKARELTAWMCKNFSTSARLAP